MYQPDVRVFSLHTHFTMTAGSRKRWAVREAGPREGRPEEVIAQAQRAAEAEPDNAFLQHELGQVLRWAGKPLEAVAPQQRAIALDAENADFHFGLGLIQRQLERPDEAEAALRPAI